MQKMQCELCDSIDIVKEDTGLYRCQHCGCQYTQEQARAMISGVVELVKGTAELERQMQNAETQMKLGEIDKAMRIYQQLSEEYPHEYRVWWAMVLCIEAEIKAKKMFSGAGDVCNSKALATCANDATRAELQRHRAVFWEELIPLIRDGTYNFKVGYNWGKTAFEDKNWLPEVLRKEGINNARTMTSKGIGYYGSTKRWIPHVDRKTDSGEITFLLGNTIVWFAYDWEHGGAMRENILEESYPFSADYMKKITDDIAEYTKERAIAKKINAADRRKYEKEQVKRGYCPSCYSFLKKTITGKCKKCGWKL